MTRTCTSRVVERITDDPCRAVFGFELCCCWAGTKGTNRNASSREPKRANRANILYLRYLQRLMTDTIRWNALMQRSDLLALGVAGMSHLREIVVSAIVLQQPMNASTPDKSSSGQ